jgi:hypothetical protein
LKKNTLISFLTALTIAGLTQTAQAVGYQSHQQLLKQEVSSELVGSLIVFAKDYTVKPAGLDTEFTPACHIEPAYPTGPAITPQGSIYTVARVDLVPNTKDPVLFISAFDAKGGQLVIHCDKAGAGRDLDEKGLSIGAAQRGLQKELGIFLITEDSVAKVAK